MSVLFWESYRCPACLVDLEGLRFLLSGDHAVHCWTACCCLSMGKVQPAAPSRAFPQTAWALWKAWCSSRVVKFLWFSPRKENLKDCLEVHCCIAAAERKKKDIWKEFCRWVNDQRSMKNGTDTACISLPRNLASYWGLEAISDRGKWKMNCS